MSEFARRYAKAAAIGALVGLLALVFISEPLRAAMGKDSLWTDPLAALGLAEGSPEAAQAER